MAKVIIELEDVPGKDRIYIRAEPVIMSLVAKHTSGNKLTAAEEKAIFVYNKLIEDSRPAERKLTEEKLRTLKHL